MKAEVRKMAIFTSRCYACGICRHVNRRFGAIVAASRVLHASAIFPVFAVILYLSLFN